MDAGYEIDINLYLWFFNLLTNCKKSDRFGPVLSPFWAGSWAPAYKKKVPGFPSSQINDWFFNASWVLAGDTRVLIFYASFMVPDILTSLLLGMQDLLRVDVSLTSG